MNFLNPLMLFGLAAASIPLLLHLLNLRKQKTVEFSSLRFIKELQKTKIRRIKLKQILLLILRTLIIIFAILAFSRPTVQSSIPFMDTYAKTSTIVVIDNSFSMDVSDENGNRFNQAKMATKSILDRLAEGDEAIIIEAANLQNRTQYSFSRNASFIKEKVDEIKISNSPANLYEALKMSSLAMEDAANINQEVFVITDAQNNIFSAQDTALIDFSSSAFYFVPVGFNSRSDIQNLSIDSINVITAIFQLDKAVDVEVYVTNHSRSDILGAVVNMSFNEERVAQRSMDIPAGQSRSILISARPQQQGAILANIELETDALDMDNKAYFGFIIPESPKIALVGNRQNSFLNIALQTSGTYQVAEVVNYDISRFSSTDISIYDIVIFTDGDFSASDFSRLYNYVENGGAAIIFSGNQISEALLGEQLQLFGFGNMKTTKYGANQTGSFSRVDMLHPLFQGVFETTDTKKTIESPDIYSANPVSGGFSIIEMSGGNFLSESQIGDGKVFYFAVSADLNKSNFPMSSLFPALVFRSIFYLSASESISRQVSVNENINLNIPRKLYTSGNFTILDPLGNEFFTEAVLLPSGAILSLENTNLPGNYLIKNPRGASTSILSVNVDPSESELNTESESNLVNKLKSFVTENTNVYFIESPAGINDSVTRARMGTELWQIFLMLTLLTALAELIVQRVSKNEIEEQ